MKSIRLALVIVGALALSGCAAGTTPAQTAAQIAAAIKQVQDYTKVGCGIIPYAKVVAAILAKAGQLDSLFSIATEICTSVTTLPLADGPGRRVPRVKGVIVRYRKA